MPYSKELHNSLNKASKQHIALMEKFNEFANFVKHCIDTPSVASNNITISLQQLDKGIFTTTFAGRTTSFVFSSALEDNGDLEGTVRCFIRSDFPEPKQIRLGEFAFNENGLTNLKLPNEDSKISIANDFGTLHIALHFIREGLRAFRMAAR
jgi:hypothetical protein